MSRQMLRFGLIWPCFNGARDGLQDPVGHCRQNRSSGLADADG
jgi:hypothetical protein